MSDFAQELADVTGQPYAHATPRATGTVAVERYLRARRLGLVARRDELAMQGRRIDAALMQGRIDQADETLAVVCAQVTAERWERPSASTASGSCPSGDYTGGVR